MDLLERAEFFKQLEDTLAEVARGQGRLVLVSGEAGIGKTSLVEHFVEKQKSNCRVLWGGCDALFTPRPLGPLYDLALQVGGDLLTLLEQQAPRATIFSAVFAELQNHPSTLLVFEDVHWADEGTLDLLKFIGRRINKLNSLLLITYRDDEVQAEHPLRLVLGDLPRSSVRRVRLPRLSEDAVRELAARAGKRIDDLYAITGGNPPRANPRASFITRRSQVMRRRSLNTRRVPPGKRPRSTRTAKPHRIIKRLCNIATCSRPNKELTCLSTVPTSVT